MTKKRENTSNSVELLQDATNSLSHIRPSDKTISSNGPIPEIPQRISAEAIHWPGSSLTESAMRGCNSTSATAVAWDESNIMDDPFHYDWPHW